MSNIDVGKWGEYMLNVANTGSHSMTFRVAAMTNAIKFDIYVNGVAVKTGVTTPATGGWETWTNVVVPGITLPKGEVYIRIVYQSQYFNFNYIDVVYESGVAATADFSATPLSACIGNQVIFTDATTNKTGSETYAWNFGTNASPATATGSGPFTVTYSSGGQKSPSLVVTNTYGSNPISKPNYITVASAPTGCIFSDDYNDNAVKWVAPIPGSFTHTESGTNWTISNSGYGEWDNFTYTLNNGSAATPLNFFCAANKPILKIKANASANCLLTVTLVDGNGRAIDNTSVVDLELNTTTSTYTIDFTGKFRNTNGSSPGVVDSSNIVKLQFAINPGFYSYPYTGPTSKIKYNAYFPGTVSIDWVGIGANCSAPITTAINDAEINTDSYQLYPNPFKDVTTVNVNSETDESVSIKVVDMKGVICYSSEQYQTNEDIKIGEGLASGIYTVVVVYGETLKTFKVIKIQ